MELLLPPSSSPRVPLNHFQCPDHVLRLALGATFPAKGWGLIAESLLWESAKEGAARDGWSVWRVLWSKHGLFSRMGWLIFRNFILCLTFLPQGPPQRRTCPRNIPKRSLLIGGLEHVFVFIYWVSNHPNWRIYVFPRGGSTANQTINPSPTNGGFLSHGGTPSHHSFIDSDFP